MSAVAEVIGVSRSNLQDRMNGSTKPRSAYHKAGDAAILPRIQRLVAKRPTYGYRRITALLNREADAKGLERVNHKRVYRIMARHGLLLARNHRERPERAHDCGSACKRDPTPEPIYDTEKYIKIVDRA